MLDLDWLKNPKSWMWLKVKHWAGVNKSDGCTGVADFYIECCWYHDKLYQTGLDFNNQPVTRAEADRRFRLCMQSRSKLGRFSPMSWWRFSGVRIFGRGKFKNT